MSAQLVVHLKVFYDNAVVEVRFGCLLLLINLRSSGCIALDLIEVAKRVTNLPLLLVRFVQVYPDLRENELPACKCKTTTTIKIFGYHNKLIHREQPRQKRCSFNIRSRHFDIMGAKRFL